MCFWSFCQLSSWSSSAGITDGVPPHLALWDHFFIHIFICLCVEQYHHVHVEVRSLLSFQRAGPEEKFRSSSLAATTHLLLEAHPGHIWLFKTWGLGLVKLSRQVLLLTEPPSQWKPGNCQRLSGRGTWVCTKTVTWPEVLFCHHPSDAKTTQSACSSPTQDSWFWL